MLLHPGTSSWAFFTKNKAAASMTPITGPFNENYLQAKPGTLLHAPPPITTPQPLVPTPNKSGMRPANVSMTRITGPFNANYLKPKPGSTYKAPTRTPWSEQGALLGAARPTT